MYRFERLKKLQGIKSLADEEMADGSRFDNETMNELAYEEENETAYQLKRN